MTGVQTCALPILPGAHDLGRDDIEVGQIDEQVHGNEGQGGDDHGPRQVALRIGYSLTISLKIRLSPVPVAMQSARCVSKRATNMSFSLPML